MDSQGLKTILSKRFTEQIQDLSPDVFKIVSKYKDRNVAAHYFDCSKNFLNADFDLLDYQRKLLGDDYYASSGPLQWNYYLYFLTDTDTTPFGTKLQIESDKSYSRKIVTTQEELLKSIEVQSKLRTQSKPLQNNSLLTIWKGKLKTVNLSAVYLIKEFPKPNDVYQHFISGEEIVETEDVPTVTLDETKVAFLDTLTMKNFRCFKDDAYKLGKVNLISGVNGTGKTSLLEAIELCLCGQTIENSRTEKADKLELAYVGGEKDTYSPTSNKKFQARDRAWYGNNRLKGNSLSQGYHIYNFFDSDAAFRFSYESNTGEKIQEIFASIILGEETNIIFDRIQRLHDRLGSETKQLSEAHRSNAVQIADYQVKIKEFDSSAMVITTLSQVITALDDIGWKGTNLLLSEGINRKQFADELIKALNFINTASSLFGERPFSSELISSENKIIQNILDEHNTFNSSNEEIVGGLRAALKARRMLEDKVKAFEIATKYYLEDRIGLIKGLNQKVIQLTRASHHLSEILKISGSINLEGDPILQVASQQTNETLVSLVDEIAQKKVQLSAIEKSVGTLNKLKVDLKRIGLEHIRLSNNVHKCPLCETEFKAGDIVGRIESIQTDLKDDGTLAKLLADIEKLEAQTLITRANNDSLKKMVIDTSIVGSLQIQSLQSLRISDISAQLSSAIKQGDEEIEQLNKLNAQFNQNNLSETELNEINSNLIQSGIKLSLGLNTKEEFIKALTETKEELNREIDNEIRLNNRRNELSLKLITSLSDYLKEVKIDEANLDSSLKRVRDSKAKLDALVQDSETIDSLIPINKLTNLNGALHAFENIKNLFERHVELESTNKLRKEYSDRIGDLNTSNIELKIKLDKYASAIAVLFDIINVNNPTNFLQEFFRENKQSILDIFKSIHVPNEFDDIQFESGESIKLKVKNSTEKRDLTEVSTGQKSAFILSLYLTLNNSLQNGPPLMIFDDPVAYVDDINTLSFLDFLRERVLAMDRQIFFATANSKLANLFQQKFDFLGDDLKLIKLKKVTSI
jgi:DNA repair protein SbcC/Rad50